MLYAWLMFVELLSPNNLRSQTEKAAWGGGAVRRRMWAETGLPPDWRDQEPTKPLRCVQLGLSLDLEE